MIKYRVALIRFVRILQPYLIPVKPHGISWSIYPIHSGLKVYGVLLFT